MHPIVPNVQIKLIADRSLPRSVPQSWREFSSKWLQNIMVREKRKQKRERERDDPKESRALRYMHVLGRDRKSSEENVRKDRDRGKSWTQVSVLILHRQMER